MTRSPNQLRSLLHSSAVIVALLSSTASGETIVLRGGNVLDEPILSVDIGGVHIGGDAPRTIGWDAVRTVAGVHAEEAGEYSDISELAWRGRVRLDRGDVTLATPLFEELYERCVGKTGPTPLLAAEGMARCALARGDAVHAVEPWLDSLRLRRLGARLAGEHETGARSEWVVHRPLVDGETSLIEAMPPMWLDGPAVDGLAQLLSDARGTAGSSSSLEGRLREWYGIAATWESTRRTDSDRIATLAQESLAPTAQAGERLVAAIVIARVGDSQQRASARAVLDQITVDAQGTWRDAWARVAIGRSLLLEDDNADRDRALEQILHAPARFQVSMPALAAIALAHAALEVSHRGETAAANRLRNELFTMTTYHGGADAALVWLDTALAASKELQERP